MDDAFPLWFPFFFVGLWLAVGGLLSLICGWVSLASFYRADRRPMGTKIRGQVVKIGWVSEHNVTGLIASEDGLYLYANPLFRFLRPPVLVPWSAVRRVRDHSLLWWRWSTLDLGGITTMQVREKGLEAMRPWLADASEPPSFRPLERGEVGTQNDP